MPRFGVTALRGLLIVCTIVFLPGMQGRTNNFDTRVLAAHNRERSMLNVAPLLWNDRLALGAQKWANHLSLANQFAHSPNVKGETLLGENIWGGPKERFTPEEMVGLWISEKRFFIEGTFPANSSTGDPVDVSHYTQLVWRETREVGCGVSRLGKEEVLVCRYSRPGNILGRDPF